MDRLIIDKLSNLINFIMPHKRYAFVNKDLQSLNITVKAYKIPEIQVPLNPFN